MTSIWASAPGKAVLSGEYAVLLGAPAISVAVNRRAVVQLKETEKDFHSIATPGFADGTWRFMANDVGEIDWLDELPGQGLRLVEEAWRATRPRQLGGLSISIDTGDFFATESGGKLGLGSSAAAMTALVGALCQLHPGQDNSGMLAGRAHTALQRGLGSGVDIATSLHGGVIEFRTGTHDAPRRHPWPEGLGYRFLWSGKPADTMSKISKLDSARGDEGSMRSLLIAADEVASEWAGGEVAGILNVFRRYADTLRQFSIDHDLGIFDAGHDELTDLAASFDVVYKPCGAGGGDIGVVLASDSHDSRAINRFCEKAETNGFQQLAVLLDPDGVRVSVGDEV